MGDWIEVFSIKDHVVDIKTTVDAVVSYNKLQSDTTGRSTTGKNSCQFDLTNHLDEFKDVIALIHDTLKINLLKRGRIGANAMLKPRTGWTVYGQEGTFHYMHWHNSSRCEKQAIATVSYISMSDNDEYRPGCIFAMINGQPTTINPKLGDLVVFPVHVYHGTYPQGPGLRQTLNIDFDIK